MKELKEFEEWLREQARKYLYLARDYKDHPDVANDHYVRYWCYINTIEKMKELDLID